MNVGKIIAAIVGVVLLYFIFTWFFSDSTRTVLTRLHNATIAQTIEKELLPKTANTHFTFSICFYVDSWNHNFGKPKTIFVREDENAQPCPKVSFDSYDNNITISLATYKKEGSADDHQMEELLLTNVPLQRWTSLILVVNGRAVDAYIDGKLWKTKVLNNIPKPSVMPIHLPPDGGFSGSTANFLYINSSLNPREVYDIYKEGCGGQAWFTDLFNRYRIKLAFLKDNVEVNTFMI